MKKNGSIVPSSCKVYTPSGLADAMVAALGDAPGLHWLDPCVGPGAFVTALHSAGVSRERIRAIELDLAVEGPEANARVLKGRDFLHWAARTRERFDRIVANPPYVAVRSLARGLRMQAARVALPGGAMLPGTANYWAAFLSISIRLVRPGGAICFVLPAAWDYASYASSLRQTLPELFGEWEEHRSGTPLFPDVQEGAVVVVGRGYGQGARRARRWEHADANQLVCSLPDPAHRQPPTTTRLLAHVGQGHAQAIGRYVQTREIASVRIGGVTGDVGFFLLNDAERSERLIPRQACTPVLTRATHLTRGVVTIADWRRLCAAGERVWLFRPNKRMRTHPAVRAYMRLRPENGGCNRKSGKVASRRPWVLTPLPGRADGFLSGMKGTGPWIALNDAGGLSASNTLYVLNFRERGLSQDRKAAWAMSILAAIVLGAQQKGRRYADGLVKFEPGDVLGLRIAVPVAVAGMRSEYLSSIAGLVAGRFAEVQEKCRMWLVRCGVEGPPIRHLTTTAARRVRAG